MWGARGKMDCERAGGWIGKSRSHPGGVEPGEKWAERDWNGSGVLRRPDAQGRGATVGASQGQWRRRSLGISELGLMVPDLNVPRVPSTPRGPRYPFLHGPAALPPLSSLMPDPMCKMLALQSVMLLHSLISQLQCRGLSAYCGHPTRVGGAPKAVGMLASNGLAGHFRTEGTLAAK